MIVKVLWAIGHQQLQLYQALVALDNSNTPRPHPAYLHTCFMIPNRYLILLDARFSKIVSKFSKQFITLLFYVVCYRKERGEINPAEESFKDQRKCIQWSSMLQTSCLLSCSVAKWVMKKNEVSKAVAYIPSRGFRRHGIEIN